MGKEVLGQIKDGQMKLIDFGGKPYKIFFW